MPAIYTSYKFAKGDSLETRRRKLYLGIISLGEDLYTFNAAVNELRKEFADLDARHKSLKYEYETLKKQG